MATKLYLNSEIETIRAEHLICKEQKQLYSLFPDRFQCTKLDTKIYLVLIIKAAFLHILTYTGNSFMVRYSNLQTTNYDFIPIVACLYTSRVHHRMCVCPCTLLHQIYYVRDGWCIRFIRKTHISRVNQ